VVLASNSLYDFELEVSGEDAAGGVILKADESEFGTAAFEASGDGWHR
jgi:hypothetical protein